jgi:hypothetical protein
MKDDFHGASAGTSMLSIVDEAKKQAACVCMHLGRQLCKING